MFAFLLGSRVKGAAVVAAVTVFSTAMFSQHARAQSAKLDDATIAAIFDAANTWDIETGSLAAKQGSTSEARAFGAMLARDHTAVRTMGRDLLKKLGVTPTMPANFPLAADHVATMKKLHALKGIEFDRAFYTLDAAYHTAVIDAVTTTLLPAIQNAELKALVTKVAPNFVAHRDAAVALRDKYSK